MALSPIANIAGQGNFAPIGDSQVFTVSSTVQRRALSALDAISPGIRLITLSPGPQNWYLKLGDVTVTATVDDGYRIQAAGAEQPVVLAVTAGQTHLSIFCEGDSGSMELTCGGLASGVLAPTAAASVEIAVTQTDQRITLPVLGTAVPALSLVALQGQMDAMWVKLGNAAVTGSFATSMKIKPGTLDNPCVIRVPSGQTHLSIFCEGQPGTVMLTPGNLKGDDGVSGSITTIPQVTGLAAQLAALALIGQGKHTIWVPATAMYKASAAAGPSTGQFTGGSSLVQYLAYDPGGLEDAFFNISMPKSWNGGTISAQFYWFHPAAVTNFTVAWQFFAEGYNDSGGITGGAFGGGGASTFDTGGSTNTLYIGPEGTAFTIGNSPASGALVNCIARRDGANGSDTLAVDALLIGVKIFYTTNAATDN